MSIKPKQQEPVENVDRTPDTGDQAGATETPAAGAPADAETNAVSGDTETPATVEELMTQLEDARATADSHWDTVLRTRAELDNLRKRSARDLENAHKFGLDRLVSEMLPVKDSVELGLAASRGEDVSIDKVREGMELTLKMFATALDKLGVAEINPEGEDFNPEFHQAMTVQEAEGRASGTVISVIQKGYLLNERLIRPALVIVAK